VRGRIDWKYALGLPLDNTGLDASVLCEFRARPLAGWAEQQLLTLCRDRGWLHARGRQRTDSTHVLAAIPARNHVEAVGETVRHALNVLAEQAPDWADRYRTGWDDTRLPSEQAERDVLVAQWARTAWMLHAVLGKASVGVGDRQPPYRGHQDPLLRNGLLTVPESHPLRPVEEDVSAAVDHGPTPVAYDALRAARQRDRTWDFIDLDAKRSGIEGTISQGVRACRLRRTRYRGFAKKHLDHTLTASHSTAYA
jgi:transposase